MQFDLFENQTNDILSQTAYASFKEALKNSNCQKCGLSKSRTNIVVDRGNPEAKIMVIGEAPGENEDLQGKAFIGRAGKLFDQVLASIGLDSNQDLFIANVVKCRPPENRKPQEEEVLACHPFLKKQIDLVKPKVILLLGATALKRIDPSKKNFSMKDETGNFFRLADYPGILFMVLYHPAALLYDSKLKPAMQHHVKKLKAMLDSGFKEPAGSGL